ncbi:hypothetical protein BJY04DRAFT_25882 [Aspergillus karnatakaensis]|uniref:twinfilin n=1 Tax=Aspergillus karnatakaensis TaxID=1810916 RepID=UPI003CCD4A52
MQSGISVSQELHDAFAKFASDNSAFCLPVTISAESLTPLATIPFSGGGNSFYPSLTQLSSVLEPKTPIYLLLRRPGVASPSLVALTYIPSNAGVRAKTLFASTRATLVRELGSEKFGETIFATDEDEVVGEKAWKDREAEKNGTSEGGYRREDLMGEKERELEAVRRAEEAARSGTPGRDIGIGGTFGRGPSRMRIEMQVDEDAKQALSGLQAWGLVQVSIDVKTETLKLADAQSGIDAESVQRHISSSSPRYSFYHYPDSDVVIFIYTCPSGSSIKERMLYASSRMYALQVAEEQGLNISKKIEAGTPDEVTGDRLHEEVHPPQNANLRQGFAKPRRPGR